MKKFVGITWLLVFAVILAPFYLSSAGYGTTHMMNDQHGQPGQHHMNQGYYGQGMMGGPVADLMNEHHLTIRMIDEAAIEAERINNSGEVDVVRVGKMLDFFQNFVDKCHHAKEERYYFPVAKKYGGQELNNLIEELKDEHRQGAQLLDNLSSALNNYRGGNREYTEQVADNLSRYTLLIQQHIPKENMNLFHPVNMRMDPEEARRIDDEFKRFEQEELGEGFHEKYRDLALEVMGQSQTRM